MNCIFYFVSDLWCLIFRKALELSILYYLVILSSHMQSKGKLFKRKSKAYTLTDKRDKINTFANYQNIIKWKRVPPLTTIFLFFLKTATSSPGSSFFQFDGVRKEDPGTQQIARTKSPRLALGNIGWSQIVSFSKKYMKNNLSPTLLCNIKWNRKNPV